MTLRKLFNGNDMPQFIKNSNAYQNGVALAKNNLML